MLNTKKKIVVICGPTGVGKTALSLSLAKKCNGEIISADSMQIYRGMDIGTAKATQNEQNQIPHHLLDIKDPSETYSLSDYLEDANVVAKDIIGRGKTPFMVGGTGLYISSFVDNIQLMETAHQDADYREELKVFAAQNGNAALKELLRSVDPESYEKLSENDTKRIIRALEIYKSTGMTIGEQNRLSRSQPSEYDFIMIGLTCKDREVLYGRINSRVDRMIEEGFIEEVRRLDLERCSNTARQAIGYKQIYSYLQGEMLLPDAIDNIKMESRRYAKRQLTWFRRDPRINWEYTDECSLDEISEKFTTFINT